MPRDPRCCKPDRQWTLPRRLRVPDIIALLRPHGKLAFLSACQTAKGDEDLSDEAIHIAAGMLFVGWSISDKLAPEVAKDMYEQLSQKWYHTGLSGGCTHVVRCCRTATCRLKIGCRSSMRVSERWAVVHHVCLFTVSPCQ